MIEQIEMTDEADLDARIFEAQKRLDNAQNARLQAGLDYGQCRSPENRQRVRDAEAAVEAATEVLQDLNDNEASAHSWEGYAL